MGRKPYSLEIKEKARSLRNGGATYSNIQRETGVPKSTLSVWFGKKFEHVFTHTKQLEHLERARVLAAKAKKKLRAERADALTQQAEKETGSFPLADTSALKGLLSVLYWAEGSKHEKVSGVKFVNTDPKLVRLYLTLLRTCFPIKEERLRIRVHLHPYHKETEALLFWSKCTSVPLKQFGKVYWKKRTNSGKRFRKNFMGICFISYLDSSVRKEILHFGAALQKRLVERPEPSSFNG